MNKILVILGPTATGKTDLGICLAKQYDGEIVSADSRQVYKGMNIGTGKDLPNNFQFHVSSLRYKNEKLDIGYAYKKAVPIWLLDIVYPDYQFNVGEYSSLGRMVIRDIQNRGKLPIIVGGTGLYIKSLVEPLSDITIPRDEKFRKKSESYPKKTLQDILKHISAKKWNEMNNSDRNNPRRLIRAIEIARFRNNPVNKEKTEEVVTYDSGCELVIGLSCERSTLIRRIAGRVEERYKGGLLNEIKGLLGKGYSFDLPSFTACGYGIWEDYMQLEGKSHREKTLKKTIEKWVSDEIRYAKRQMTFFNKMRKISWFDIENNDYYEKIINKVGEWYNTK